MCKTGAAWRRRRVAGAEVNKPTSEPTQVKNLQTPEVKLSTGCSQVVAETFCYPARQTIVRNLQFLSCSRKHNSELNLLPRPKTLRIPAGLFTRSRGERDFLFIYLFYRPP